jgi:hypothetical protein
MDQLLERGMVTAPRETETPMTPASRRARIIIQKIHLLKVQRDIKTAFNPKTAFSCQLSAKRIYVFALADR